MGSPRFSSGPLTLGWRSPRDSHRKNCRENPAYNISFNPVSLIDIFLVGTTTFSYNWFSFGFLIELKFGTLDFQESDENWSTQRKTLETRKETTTKSTHIVRSLLHTCINLAPQRVFENFFIITIQHKYNINSFQTKEYYFLFGIHQLKAWARSHKTLYKDSTKWKNLQSNLW